MSNVAIFKSGEAPQYLKSVNTPDYEGDPDVLINPDIAGFSSVPLKYWKRVNDEIEEMTQVEKDALEAAELQARKDAVTLGFDDMKIVLTTLIKVINLRLPVEQKITKSEMIVALKGEIV